MKKLSLNLDDLSVDSFEIAAAEEPRGTVHGNEATDYCSVSCGNPFSSLFVYWAMVAGN